MPRVAEPEWKQTLEQLTDTVLRLNLANGAPVTPSQIAAETGSTTGTLAKRLAGAVERGLMMRHEGGVYSAAVDGRGRALRWQLLPVRETPDE
jgi:hypothetical protein